jgi:hypothetical protein
MHLFGHVSNVLLGRVLFVSVMTSMSLPYCRGTALALLKIEQLVIKSSSTEDPRYAFNGYFQMIGTNSSIMENLQTVCLAPVDWKSLSPFLERMSPPLESSSFRRR